MNVEQLARDFGVRPEQIKEVEAVKADGDLAVTVTLNDGSTMQLMGEMAVRFCAFYNEFNEMVAS
jgi:hypothetical protein